VDEAQVAGLVCLGYPFHPVGKPERLRIEHLKTIRTPTLIIQGERDPFGNRQAIIASYLESPQAGHRRRIGETGWRRSPSS
jgi:hypothetical protein